MVAHKMVPLYFLLSLYAPVYPGFSAEQDRAETIVHHLAVMTEFKTKQQERVKKGTLKKNKKVFRCASDIHRNMPELRDIIAKQWPDFLRKHKALTERVFDKEREYTRTHYVFYHAQRSIFRILQDFLQILGETLHIARSVRDFKPLRSWVGMAFVVDANTFIDTLNAQYPGGWNEIHMDMASKILSVNLALFGNCSRVAQYECTFDYFARGYNIKNIDLAGILREIFEHYNFNTRYIDELVTLGKEIETQEGLLMQLCIPKKLVNTCAYICLPCAIPIDFKIPGCTFDQERKRNVYISEVLEQYRQGKKFTQALEESRKQLAGDGWLPHDGALILDLLQARLVFSRDILLNPDAGVVATRYSTLDPTVEHWYQQRLRTIVHALFTDFIASGGYTKIPGELKLAKFCSIVTHS